MDLVQQVDWVACILVGIYHNAMQPSGRIPWIGRRSPDMVDLASVHVILFSKLVDPSMNGPGTLVPGGPYAIV